MAGIPLDWPLLGTFLSLTLLGMLFGTVLARKTEGAKLKKAFGIFTLLVGIAVMAQQFCSLF
jgi:uncharacterized membrane protein YfcA